MDADGDFVVAWASSGQSGTSEDVFVRRYNALGEALGGEVKVNVTTTVARMPAVAMDAEGDFVVTWRAAGPGDSYGIFGQRFSAAGAAQGGEFLVNNPNPAQQVRPSVAADADGDSIVAWQSYSQDGDNYGIVARRFDAGGVPRGNEFQVNTTTALQQGGARIALDTDGDFTIFWDGNGAGDDSGVFFQRYNAAGLPQGGESRVNTYTANTQYNPFVAGDADGDLVVVWQSQFQDGSRHGRLRPALRRDHRHRGADGQRRVDRRPAGAHGRHDPVSRSGPPVGGGGDVGLLHTSGRRRRRGCRRGGVGGLAAHIRP